jgi:hypothetical protein
MLVLINLKPCHEPDWMPWNCKPCHEPENHAMHLTECLNTLRMLYLLLMWIWMNITIRGLVNVSKFRHVWQIRVTKSLRSRRLLCFLHLLSFKFSSIDKLMLPLSYKHFHLYEVLSLTCVASTTRKHQLSLLKVAVTICSYLCCK